MAGHPAGPAVTAAAAGTWRLGNQVVNRLGFGAMRLTQRGSAFGKDALPSDRAQAIAVLRRAVNLGVNHIDTAAFYFSALRSANELINSALAPYPEDLVIVTKVGPGRDPHGEWTDAARPDQLRGQVEENLRQLGRDHLDVVNLRRMPSMGASIAEHFGALASLRDTGLIRCLGVSGVTPADLAEAEAIAPVVCVQNAFTLGRSDDPMLDICGAQDIAFVPFFAISGAGRHGGPADSGVPADVQAMAAAHGATPAQIRLAWTLHQGPHVLAIPGTGDLEHLQQNVAAAAIRLSPAELSVLNALA
ncbi:MAG TPA: aldo/keto reductase [Streptosporangiaceae bacterium]|jgi:aryl-alcohol dehydrogenase-like predicted oxidoreductase